MPSSTDRLLTGRPAVLSYATVAELRFGAALAGWGAGRLQRLDAELATVEKVWPGPNLMACYVSLRAWCMKAGHGLAHKDHEADRWIAATAYGSTSHSWHTTRSSRTSMGCSY